MCCLCVCGGGGGGEVGEGEVGEKCGCDMYESNVHYQALEYTALFSTIATPFAQAKDANKSQQIVVDSLVVMYTHISPRERSSVSVSADIGFIRRSCISPIPRPPSVPIPGHGQSHSQTKCQA